MAAPGYLLVLGHSLEMTKMAQYSAALPPIYQKFGGFYLGIGGPGRGVELLEGAWFDHSMVLAQFASKADIPKFWHSPEYTEAKQLRKGAGVFNVFAMQGNSHAAPKGQPSFMITIYRPFDEFKTNEINAREDAKLEARGVNFIAKAKFAETERLEGDMMDFDFRIAAFPTQAAATNYWNEPSVRALREERQKAAGVNTFLVAGVPRK
ncbi:MAG: DUF1330 domain-containing protein [Rhodospirillaceae bacterium]|nr:DUF1330 domain-containing protein [Rhodospirillaceae bacterium]